MGRYGKKIDESFALGKKRALGFGIFTGGITFLANIGISLMYFKKFPFFFFFF